MDLVIGLVVGFVAGVAVGVVFFILRAGGAGQLALGLKVAARAAADPEFARKAEKLFAPPEPPKPSAEPVRLLRVLQHDSRLIDFLMENLQPYSDDQIGASVRDIQRKAQESLQKHLVLEPVLAGAEGATVTVPAGFDPSAVRLVGNVTGQPPFQGVLEHAGWKVREIRLAPPPEGQDPFVLFPAEVELP